MLSSFLDLLFRSAFNAAAHAVERLQDGRRNRRARKSAPNKGTKTKDVEPEFILGERIPSALELLQQNRREVSLSVVLTLEQRLRHQYVLGGTGTGKTNLLNQQLLADVEAGFGVCLLDARGDLLDRVLLRLAAKYRPEELADRLVLVDLRSHSVFGADGEPVVGVNLLTEAGGDPYTRALFVLDLLRGQFGSGLGVQTEEILRNALLALAMTSWTLLEVEALLTVPGFRAQVLRHVTDGAVLRFFERFAALPETQQGQWVSPVMNKLTPWLARPSLRHILGQKQGGLSFRTLFEDRPDAIVLICTAKDELFAAADFLTNLIVSAVAGAVMRPDRSLAARKRPVFLYLDEFENLAEASKQFEAMVSEARRYGLGLLFAHQSTVQLEPKIRSLIRNVVGTQVYFAVGGLDADQLAGEMPSDEPRAVLRNLLISQKTGEALVLMRGQPVQRIRTPHQPDPAVAPATVAALRQASLLKWGRARADVERELSERETLYRAGGVSGPTLSATPVEPPALEVRETASATAARRTRGKGKKP